VTEPVLLLRPADYRRACRHLTASDPVMASIIDRHGACGMGRFKRADPYRALVEAIVWQQLSTKAAATIYGRLLALFPADGGMTPAAVGKIRRDRLRRAGLSWAKVDYVKDLSAKVNRGTLDLAALERASDDDVVAALTAVKGIGRWSADMFLMFRLGRPDVLPVGDLGIVKAMQKAYRMRKRPTAKRMFQIAEPWRPYRSVASWYLWESTENAPVVRK
jgi:3-methyladenine DNA glycosylase/8-oxoguanine DNA glycosylase|tara:strand:+ start:701 stop:1357 length:657 start_codon:yes stop_codon:yes gene_type:complete